MNCKNAEELLVEYLYQELSAKKTVEVEKHLRSCKRCEKTLESWRAIHRGYQRTVEAPQPSPYLKQRILAVAREEAGKPAPWGQRMMLWLKLATIPVTIFVIVILFQSWKKEPQMVQQPAVTYTAPQKAEPVLQTAKDQSDVQQREVLSESKRDYREEDDAPKGKVASPDEERMKQKNEGFELGRAAAGEDKLSELELGEQQAASAPAPAAPTEQPAAEMAQETMPPSPDQQLKKSTQAEAGGARARDQDVSVDQFRQSQVALMNKDVKSGIALAKEAVRNDQNKSLAPQLHQSAIQFQNSGEYAQAIAQFNLVLNDYGGYSETPDVLLRLGDSYAQLGQFAEARKTYQQLLRYSNQRKVAAQKIQELDRKQKAQEDLKALGYVN